MDVAETLDLVALKDAWEGDETREQIAQKFNIPYRSLLQIARKHKWPVKERAPKKNDPTPEQIAERAAELRKKWRPADERKRSVGKGVSSWQPPTITYNISRHEFETE